MKAQTVYKLLAIALVVALLASCAPPPTPQVVEKVVTQVVTVKETVPVEVTVKETVMVQSPPEVVEITSTPLPPKPEVEPVSVRTNWLYYGSHSPFFLGKEKGIYLDNYLDVAVKQGNGSGNVVKLVANKDSTFGYVSAAALINQVAQGAPVIAVATIDAAGTDAVLCNPDSGIATIKDLEGKTILTTAGAGVNAFWPVVVKNAGLDESKIKLTNVAEAALVSSYLQGLAPCILGGIDDKPAEIEANGGKTPTIFAYSDYGVAQPGYVIVAHTDTVKEKPDMVRRFVEATLESFKAAQADPDASVKAMADFFGPEQFDEKSIEQAKKVLAVTLSILYSQSNKDKILGWNSEEDFASALDLFKKYKELQTDMPPSAFFTNEFVPKTLP
jgi:NitT/TauT family transport system substrate-binding protein